MEATKTDEAKMDENYKYLREFAVCRLRRGTRAGKPARADR